MHMSSTGNAEGQLPVASGQLQLVLPMTVVLNWQLATDFSLCGLNVMMSVTKSALPHSSVAQWQSIRLLTGGL